MTALLAGLLAILAACDRRGDTDPVASALSSWPDDPTLLAARCDGEVFDELRTTCRIQAASGLAAAGDASAATALCDAVAPGTWQEECRFRVGEELAAAGMLAAGVRSCGQAGWFARRCLTHAAWRLRLDSTGGPTAEPAALRAELSELLDLVEAGLSAHDDPGVVGEGRDAVRAAWGRAVYLGRGVADPAPARGDDEAAPALRTGWATEAARLLGPDLPDDAVAVLLQAWQGGQTMRGPADPDPPPERYPPLALGPHDNGLPHLPLYGGGLRLVGETEDEDARIAILHALYGRPDAGPTIFEPSLSDDRPRVRWTAATLALLAAGPDDRALRARIAGDDDPVLQWLAARSRPRPGPGPASF